jgi:hypothetical protein
MSRVINITVPVSHNGRHYPGLSLRAGVSMNVIPGPCDPSIRMVEFPGSTPAIKPVFLTGITHIDDSQAEPVPAYLDLR